MGKWRDETVELKCGCKVGRSKQGVWLYDYLCEEHVEQVYEKEVYWSCSTCGREFTVEGDGRVHLDLFKHGVLYSATRKKYSLELSEKLTEKLQKLMKEREEETDVNLALEMLSPTEMRAYEFIRDAEQPLPIRDMPHQLQGAVGRLISQEVIERYRTQAKVTKHGFTSLKMINCVRVKE